MPDTPLHLLVAALAVGTLAYLDSETGSPDIAIAAIEHAQKIGARTVDLTSRPSREAANRLYRRAGFELRETNVYRYAQV